MGMLGGHVADIEPAQRPEGGCSGGLTDHVKRLQLRCWMWAQGDVVGVDERAERERVRKIKALGRSRVGQQRFKTGKGEAQRCT